jgi:hypothetical protein
MRPGTWPGGKDFLLRNCQSILQIDAAHPLLRDLLAIERDYFFLTPQRSSFTWLQARWPTLPPTEQLQALIEERLHLGSDTQAMPATENAAVTLWWPGDLIALRPICW